MKLLPASDRVWAGQPQHVSGVTAATVVEYRSIAQRSHTADPLLTL